ncbi:MAG TPA: N-acetylmuramoyl-L-alanine amidase [Flavisolibacter sp.]|nr:N-acetylmuramoyl-L-alanine amidase [Flavisolibacter sp.]
MLKKSSYIFSIFTIALVLTSFTPVPKQDVIKTIIVDAGHGIMPNGGHNGAKGTFSYEDEICLAISKKLVTQLRKEFPEIKIIETRPSENIVSLRERANIANRNRGDLFISIHVNAMPPLQRRELVGYKNQVSYVGRGKKKKKVVKKIPQYHTYEVPNTSVKGTQTYIWGAHKSEDKEVALRENAPMLVEENYKQQYGEIDPNSPEFIALSLAKTKQFTVRSATLAGMVEDQFAKIGRISGGKRQRQAGIWVLQATAMPSILVETGFITNPEEERYLNSESGQNEIATGITKAVHQYILWLEKRQISSGVTKTPAHKVPDDFFPFLQALDAHTSLHIGK